MEGYKTFQFLLCRLTQVDWNDIAETAVLLNSETRTHNTTVSVIKKLSSWNCSLFVQILVSLVRVQFRRLSGSLVGNKMQGGSN